MLPDPSTPRHVPAIRDHIYDQWRPTGTFTEVTRLMRGDTDIPLVERRELRDATLWWVSAEMMDLLLAAVPAVPDDVRLSDLPTMDPSGVVVFEKPFLGIDSETGERVVSVDAIVWGNVTMPAEARAHAQRDNFPARMVSSYQFVRAGEGWAGGAPMPMDSWVPLGRSDWPLDEAVGDWTLVNPLTWEPSETMRDAAQDDRRLLAALWTFLDNRTIVSRTCERLERAARRRSERSGFSRNDIIVATLRRVAVGHPDSEPTGRHFSHRFPVTGHWRNARVGPGRAERRLTWVSPHIKGQGEFVPKRRVNAWRR